MSREIFDKAEAVAEYLGEAQTRMFLTYMDSEIKITSNCLTRTNQIFYKGKLIFSKSNSDYSGTKPTFVPGNWEEHLNELYQKAERIKEQKLRAVSQEVLASRKWIL